MDMVSNPSQSKANQGIKGPKSAIATQAEILAKGQSILSDMPSDNKSIFNKDWWYGQIMDWSMKNESFKTQMFRFVDVLPYLNSGSEVARHLKEYFAENGEKLPPVFGFGLGLGSLAPGLLAGAVKKNVTQMAKMFITGETPQEALPVLKKARESGLTFTVDLLGEATLSEAEAKDYSERYMQLIQWLAKDASSWQPHPVLDHDENGAIPKVNVSVKVTSLYSQVHETAWDETIAILKERIRPLFHEAIAQNVFINIDMEQYAHKDLTLDLFQQILLEDDFKAYPHFGIVIQAYLRDSERDIDKLLAFAKRRGAPFTVRLVKGAYWDYEVIKAKQKGWPVPVYTNKPESDVNYEKCAQRLIEGYPFIRLAIGSHNVRSISACLVMAENAGLPRLAIEVQMLYGMADQIKKSFIKQGYRVREYATVGELIPGMAYLVRRLLENTSNESWLKNKFADNASSELLLADPMLRVKKSEAVLPKKTGVFYNEPPLDFAVESVRHEFLKALSNTKKQFPIAVPAIVDGKELKAKNSWARVNPSHPQQVVAQVSLSTPEDCEKAIQSAKKAFATWSQKSPEFRADIIEKVADLIAENRHELAAIEVHEVGKPWSEADGDICEAIDFCRYYAKEMKRLGRPFRTGHAPGEISLYHYQGKGVAAVIAPWNFPLAILAGLVTSCVVAGNTVVMKPAEQSSLVALKLMQILKKAGLPEGVVNFIPGQGEVVGEYLTGHKDIDIISFTGSQQVGLHIVRKAAETQVGQKGVKRCVIEMGGKNAIILDSDADLDEAVAGVLYSAFGFQGQKCSACSRVIVLEGIYDRFIQRLVEATKSLHIGPAEDAKSYMGPVVDIEAMTKIKSLVERAMSQFKLSYMGEVPPEGYFVPPTIFQDVNPDSELAQQEIFGPVLAIIKAKDIDHALEIGNGTQYALTGGLYSRSPAHIEKVKARFEVGNLYINRGNTGAIVERHPFGGFKMSGVGSKTGGPDYLIQFMDPKVVTENTMRRGFAPPEDSDV